MGRDALAQGTRPLACKGTVADLPLLGARAIPGARVDGESDAGVDCVTGERSPHLSAEHELERILAGRDSKLQETLAKLRRIQAMCSEPERRTDDSGFCEGGTL